MILGRREGILFFGKFWRKKNPPDTEDTRLMPFPHCNQQGQAWKGFARLAYVSSLFANKSVKFSPKIPMLIAEFIVPAVFSPDDF